MDRLLATLPASLTGSTGTPIYPTRRNAVPSANGSAAPDVVPAEESYEEDGVAGGVFATKASPY